MNRAHGGLLLPIGLCCLLVGAAGSCDEIRTVPQVWQSTGVDYGETDSLTACALPGGEVRVFASAKEADRIDVFNAATGEFIASHGQTGSGVGEFAYPNGVVAVEFTPQTLPGYDGPRVARILVVERDNQRVQAFTLDDFKPAGVFGADVLHKPYGGAVSYRPDGVYLYVTDTEVPRDKTVRVFKLALDAQQHVAAELVRTFGDVDGPGAIVEAESIVVDDRTERVLLCDEGKTQHDVKVYTLDGKFTGQTFGGSLVKGDPEGIVVVDAPKGGCVVLTDQRKSLSVWHVFDRRSYRHIGAFTGEPTIANTDGICIHQAPLPNMPAGGFFAVNDDADVRAFSLANIHKLAD